MVYSAFVALQTESRFLVIHKEPPTVGVAGLPVVRKPQNPAHHRWRLFLLWNIR